MKKVILFVLFALCSTMMLAQETITVKGTVISSEDGLPVIGAYVLQQGTNNGTSTDVDGNFTIEVPKLATLVVKMVGFHDQEIAVQGRAILNISLAPESVNLEEVMIVAYGTAKKGTVAALTAGNISNYVFKSHALIKNTEKNYTKTPVFYA